jgi:hypothetical protein
MKPSQSISALKKSILILFCLLSVSAGVFADKGVTISEQLQQIFKQTFPNAEQVKWLESSDKITVNFTDAGVLTKVDYDKDGNFMSSVRYYYEKNLPVNIICKLKKRFSGKTVFGVTEMTTESSVVYYVKLEDEKSWTTVKSDVDGNMEVVEKYKKAL